MKKLNFRINIIFLSVLLAFCCLFSFGKVITNEAYANGSSSEIVMERDSKRVLYESNAHNKMFMASTTKIVTAITVIENCDIEREVKITKESVGVEGSSIYLEVGEVLTIKDLLYGLMLRSGNDCAETLALAVCGSIGGFSELMNKTAKKVGALNSNFVNPHGLHDENHYTTAYDLALISCYAMQNETFREIVQTKYKTIPFTTKNTTRTLKNKNKLLFNLEGATGIKTGYTLKAGRCLVSSCYRHGIEVICVVLNCPPMFERSENLLNNALNNYDNYNLIESDNIIDFVKCGDKEVAIHIKKDIILPLTKEEFNLLSYEYVYPNEIKSVEKDKEIGYIKVFVKNNLLFTEKIYIL